MNAKDMQEYCIYCKYSKNEIRKINRREGDRVPCRVRDTKRGFHSFGIRCKKCKKNWRYCICK